MPFHVSADEFDGLVNAVLDTIPADLRIRMDDDNLMIVIEPDEDALAASPRILGYFQGRGDGPGSYASPFSPVTFPKRIVILQGHIERFCSSRDELEAMVRDTVLHEVAHYFGMNHGDIAQTGLRH